MFNGNILRDAIISAANNLANNRKQVDDLNVFPVPDGDTGTNMSMTLANSVRELEKIAGATAGKVASVNASALLRGALEKVVEEGGGKNAGISGYRIGGKTGTAQVYVDGVVSSDKHIGSFVGFAPIDDPRIAVLVIV